jgi:hypothetical protein
MSLSYTFSAQFETKQQASFPSDDIDKSKCTKLPITLPEKLDLKITINGKKIDILVLNDFRSNLLKKNSIIKGSISSFNYKTYTNCYELDVGLFAGGRFCFNKDKKNAEFIIYGSGLPIIVSLIGIIQ